MPMDFLPRWGFMLKVKMRSDLMCFKYIKVLLSGGKSRSQRRLHSSGPVGRWGVCRTRLVF